MARSRSGQVGRALRPFHKSVTRPRHLLPIRLHSHRCLVKSFFRLPPEPRPSRELAAHRFLPDCFRKDEVSARVNGAIGCEQQGIYSALLTSNPLPKGSHRFPGASPYCGAPRTRLSRRSDTPPTTTLLPTSNKSVLLAPWAEACVSRDSAAHPDAARVGPDDIHAIRVIDRGDTGKLNGVPDQAPVAGLGIAMFRALVAAAEGRSPDSDCL